MNQVGKPEGETQDRVIKLFKDKLGYDYLGSWQDRNNGDNKNIEEEFLKPFLEKRGYSKNLIKQAFDKLEKAIALGGGRNLYDANKEFYNLLRYGIKVKESIGEQTQTVWLIDWKNKNNNQFALAEEVSIKGKNNKRPDIVLYINGIAVAVIELKSSTTGLTEGIRQNLQNQNKDFIRSFFTTIQLTLAGNDTQGLRYGTIETSEKYYLEWKEQDSFGDYKLDRHLSLLCQKDRLLELIYNFIIFDKGTKKVCSHQQYFAIKETQKFIHRNEGGIIWHTQGSGKSITMVWLAKWIRENKENSRVFIITDRTELDEQIEKVFKGVEENIYRTESGEDLINTLNKSEPWLVCSLIHKFASSGNDQTSDDDIKKLIKEIKEKMRSNFEAKGNIYVFVDECHRTQSNKLHSAMKEILPNALFIGFTGTPLLKDDKKTSSEVFGNYIHTYKFDEAVRDGTVLDLRYEARDIDQNITSQEKIDEWFNIKTKGLTEIAKAELKKKWGTMQKVLSSKSRLEQIVKDILMDMNTKPRLSDGSGNAILIATSIYEACRFYELFDQTEIHKKCAIITSYNAPPESIRNEETGEGNTDKITQYNIYKKMLADFFEQSETDSFSRVEEFEIKVKEKFIKDPGQMRLLIVVDKLLTGFDAPPATYLYINKQMRDHGLFQAICRVNRLDGENKEYGYIVDYQNLFGSLQNSIQDYTSGAFDQYDKKDIEGLLKNRLTKEKERLDEAREAIKTLCEKVAPPKDTNAYLKYFCGKDSDDKDALKNTAFLRLALYKKTSSFIRAYAALANEMADAGYSPEETEKIKDEVKHYESVQKEVKLRSGDYIDMKVYEPGMRHLIDKYISAEESQKILVFDKLTLVQLLVRDGENAIKNLPKGIQEDEDALAETIENNLRKTIIDEQAINPKYYEEMSKLLDALVEKRKKKALDYKSYLKKLLALTKKVTRSEMNDNYPKSLDTDAKRALYDNLGKDEDLAIKVDEKVKKTKRDGFRGDQVKEREIKNAIAEVLPNSYDTDERDQIFEIIKKQNEY